MAIKASNQVTLIDLTDAYSVILTNEAHTFIGNTDSVSSQQSTTTQVYAYCGSQQVSASVGTISAPTGLSFSSDGKTPAPTVTITATTALKTGGTVDIPISVTAANGDTISITKKFSYSIAFTGAKGATGNTGNGVSGTNVTYQTGNSGTTVPTGTWSGTIPTVAAGKYLWTKTVISYTNGTSSTSYSVGMMGNTGATGKGVKSTEVTYQAGSSGTTAPTGTWGSSVPTVPNGQYLWTKKVTTYTDNTTSTEYSVGYKGTNGINGADAITVVVTSSNGLIFKNSDIATTLTAHVYRGGTEITGTALSGLGSIKWYKDGGSTAVATGTTFSISAGDIDNKASYVAQLEG